MGRSRLPIVSEWKGACLEVVSHKPNGHGYIDIHGVGPMHRAVYQSVWGPIPDGCVVMHSCDNKLCVNPHHLSAGSIAQNVSDSWDRQPRKVSGENHPRSKLTDVSVADIRSGRLKNREFADLYGVHVKTVEGVRSRHRWGHI